MGTMVEQLMARYGTDLTLVSGEESRTVRGFFRAVSSTSWQSMEHQTTLLGEVSQGQYAYIGPADARAREGDLLLLNGKTYLLRRVEDYYYGNSPVYQWGLCVERSGVDAWGV